MSFDRLVLPLLTLAVIALGLFLMVMRSRKKPAKATDKQDWDEDKEARLKALLKEENNGDKS